MDWYRLSVAICLPLTLVMMLLIPFAQKKPRQPRYATQLEKWVLVVVLLSMVYLAGTGFIIPLVFQVALEKYMLLGHVAIGGLFTVGLAGLAILGSSSRGPDQSDRPISSGELLQSGLFWLFLLLGLLTSSSMLVSMTPLMDTDGLNLMLTIHRWSALWLTCVAMMFMIWR